MFTLTIFLRLVVSICLHEVCQVTVKHCYKLVHLEFVTPYVVSPFEKSLLKPSITVPVQDKSVKTDQVKFTNKVKVWSGVNLKLVHLKLVHLKLVHLKLVNLKVVHLKLVHLKLVHLK